MKHLPPQLVSGAAPPKPLLLLSEIMSVKENAEMKVHNLSVIKDNHTFFANGMLVHNFGDQQGLFNEEK